MFLLIPLWPFIYIIKRIFRIGWIQIFSFETPKWVKKACDKKAFCNPYKEVIIVYGKTWKYKRVEVPNGFQKIVFHYLKKKRKHPKK